ncbi:MAG: hypothetical protein VX438_07580 [Planctomycetota bacterium]|nr:hypothetical protein [Planctomycetota bacterium]
MTQIDQFESIFRAASKTLFQYSDWPVKKVLTISDGSRDEAKAFESQVKQFVANAFDIEQVDWEVVQGNQFTSVGQLVEIVNQTKPDLICSHRNLQIPSEDFPYSLGVYIDVLTQATTVPVLLLPNPSATG